MTQQTKTTGFDDPRVIEENRRLHKTHAEIAAGARTAELLLWKAIGRPRPKAATKR